MTVDLVELLRAVAGRDVLVVGDAMLDVYLRGVTRGLCREAPAPVVDVQSSTAVAGGAANAAVTVAALGGRARLAATIGADEPGRQLDGVLRAAGVDTAALCPVPGRRTLVKRRVVVGSHLLLRLDEGDTEPAELGAALQLTASAPQAVLISDRGHGTLAPELARGLREQVPVVVVDARDPAVHAGLRPTAVTPNYAEAVRLLGVPALDGDAARLRQIRQLGAQLLAVTAAELVVTTLGAAGAVLFERGRAPLHSRANALAEPHAAQPEVVGAGDVFAAALTLALAAHADPPAAVEFATLTATLAVTGAGGCAPGTAVGCAQDVLARLRATGKVRTQSELRAMVAAAHHDGRRVVFTNGCFDILHEGHVALLNQAKALGDVLVVGVNDDESVRSLKGSGRPVVPLGGRLRLLAALSCVDHVAAFSGPTPAELIELVRPHVFAKGGDYHGVVLPEAEQLHRIGAEIRILPFVPDRSTTGIIDRVRALS